MAGMVGGALLVLPPAFSAVVKFSRVQFTREMFEISENEKTPKPLVSMIVEPAQSRVIIPSFGSPTLH
jgi:hypothetical protein